MLNFTKGAIVKPLYAVVFFVFCCSSLAFSQATFDASFQPITFTNASKSHRVGTDGSGVGNVTLYTNVITIGGQAIDCIVRTVSLTGNFQLPGAAAVGTIPFDYSSATGTGMSANNDNFFSPTFNFAAGGGSCRFRFEFILGGSFNNGTNTGTAVNLQNVYLNSYDIDGNGGGGTNQFNEYNGFSSYSLGTGTTVGASFNATSRLTRFLSSISTNSSVVTDQTTRIRVSFNTISTLDVVVGSQGAGQAFFFLDFSIGTATWTPTTVTTPVLDLNTTTAGSNNTGATCTSASNISSGTTNYSNTVGSINELRITFPTASITDGNNETLVVNGSTTPANASLQLGFAASSSSTFVLSGATVRAQRSVAAGVSSIVFTNNAGGTLTSTQAEAIIDALQYKHNAVTPTNGSRAFTLEVQDGPLLSNPTSFTVNVGCSTLPVSWLYFNARANATETELSWATSFEQDNAYFEVERSTDAVVFNRIGRIHAIQQPGARNEYRFTDLQTGGLGMVYYRLKQVDKNGTYSYSKTVTVKQSEGGSITMLALPSADVLQVNVPQVFTAPVQLHVFDANGRMLIRRSLQQGVHKVNLSAITATGIYTVTVSNHTGVLYTNRFIK